MCFCFGLLSSKGSRYVIDVEQISGGCLGCLLLLGRCGEQGRTVVVFVTWPCGRGGFDAVLMCAERWVRVRVCRGCCGGWRATRVVGLEWCWLKVERATVVGG